MTEAFSTTLGQWSRPVWAGVKDGICFHRCIVYFVHEHKILVKIGHCMSLNAGIFLGSIASWRFVVGPAAAWILRLSGDDSSPHFVQIAMVVLDTVFVLLWLLPVYLITFPLTCMWYQEIAELAYSSKAGSRGNNELGLRAKPQKEGAVKQPDVLVQAAQEVYRVVLFGVFYLQIVIAGYMPFIGSLISFVLLSWLNALYSFDYKWSLGKQSLEHRVYFFETHWAFFAGFGSVCTLLSLVWTLLSHRLFLFWPIFSDAAFLAILYPFFILIASHADPGKDLKEHPGMNSKDTQPAGSTKTPRHLPIFQTSIALTTWIMSASPDIFQLPGLFQKHRLKVYLLLAVACLLPALSFQATRF